MALLSLRHDPSPRELRWFGLVNWPLFLVVGYLLGTRAGWPRVGYAVAGAGTALVLVYYALPPFQRLLHASFMALLFPLGWVLSHALLWAVFLLAVTPIGLARRLLGRDDIHRERAARGRSGWRRREGSPPPGRYFRQF